MDGSEEFLPTTMQRLSNNNGVDASHNNEQNTEGGDDQPSFASGHHTTTTAEGGGGGGGGGGRDGSSSPTKRRSQAKQQHGHSDAAAEQVRRLSSNMDSPSSSSSSSSTSVPPVHHSLTQRSGTGTGTGTNTDIPSDNNRKVRLEVPPTNVESTTNGSNACVVVVAGATTVSRPPAEAAATTRATRATTSGALLLGPARHIERPRPDYPMSHRQQRALDGHDEGKEEELEEEGGDDHSCQPGAYSIYQRANGVRPDWSRHPNPNPNRPQSARRSSLSNVFRGSALWTVPPELRTSNVTSPQHRSSQQPSRSSSEFSFTGRSINLTPSSAVQQWRRSSLTAYLEEIGATQATTVLERTEIVEVALKHRKRKNAALTWILAGLALLAIGLGLGLGLYFGLSNGDTSGDSRPSIIHNSEVDFEREWKYYRGKVGTLSSDITLREPSTPQYKALQWLASTALLDSSTGESLFSNDRILTRYTLAVLYYSTDGPSWADQVGFLNPESHECTWNKPVQLEEEDYVRGVLCDDQDEEVQQLSFAYNNLGGTLPNELDALHHLQLLNFSANSISGSLKEWPTLNELGYFNIASNKLNSTIPDMLWKIRPNLTNVFLDQNQLTGSLSNVMGEASSLERLVLDANRLDGSLPTSIEQLTALTSLELQFNRFSGSVPSSLGQLPSLRRLHFRENAFTGAFPWESFAHSASSTTHNCTLKDLSLQANLFSGSVPWETLQTSSGWSCLEVLLIQASGLSSGRLPDGLAVDSLDHLVALDLKDTNTVGPLPDSFGNLTALRFLDLSSNELTGTIPASWSGMESMEQLGLETNFLTGTIPEALGDLSRLTQLDLSQNELGGTIPSSLARIGGLTHFSVWGNVLTGTLPRQFAQADKLVVVSLSFNQLDGTVDFMCVNDRQFESFDADCNSKVICSCCRCP